MTVKEYQRENALAYAQKWALSRNPNYLNFDNMGGDCTNFISQCLYAGCPVMNDAPIYGWYYDTSEERTASWTGVEYLYNFLVGNQGAGPFATEVPITRIQVGDIIQLGNHARYYHSLFVTSVGENPAPGNVTVATHTFDTLHRVLNTYSYHRVRFLHIEGYREP